MAPTRRRNQSSSATSSSPERRKRKVKRGYSYRMKHASSRSRRRERSPSSDFDEYRRHHKYSPQKRHYRTRRHASYSRRRISSDSYDSDDYHRYYRHRRSSIHHRPPRRSFSRRRRISSSPDYPPSRDMHHWRNPALVTPKRKCKPIESDIEVIEEEKRSKKKCCRSSSKECSNAHRLYEKSGKLLQEGDFDGALSCINSALKLHGNGDNTFLSKIYSRRGTIYSLKEKPRCTLQAFIDWEQAYMLDDDNMESRKSMSKVLFMGANKLYRKKAYSKALVPVMRALELDKTNGEASILLRLIQKKLVEEIERKDIVITKKCHVVSKPCTKTDSKKASDASHVIFSEIERLNKLTALALNENNYPRAIIYVNKALRFHKELPGELIFRQLLKLKRQIMKNVTRCPELTSD